MQVFSRLLETLLLSRQKGLFANKFVLPTVGVVASLAITASSFAAPVVNNYGNFTGPNLTYLGVTEVDNQIPPPTPPNLFGTPALAGDSLLFSPINFDITVTSPPDDSELQDGKLSMSIVAN